MTETNEPCISSDDDSGPCPGEAEERPPEPEPEPEPEPRFDIACTADASIHVDTEWLRERVRSALGALGADVERLLVNIVDDDEMSRLHVEFSGDPSTTDVLTFQLSDPGAPIEVEIAVCIDEARRQAVLRGHTPERELLLYILHGLLHCAGYDDRDDDAYRLMHAEEDRILEAIGVGATFHAEGGAA